MSTLQSLIEGADGIPSAFTKDKPVGTIATGPIVEAGVVQARDYETGAPLTWDDGNPQQQVRVVIQTNERDPMRPDDDGKRAIFIKWWGDQRKALVDAIKAAGDNDIRVGGIFWAQFTGEKPNENSRLNAAKLFAYQYQKPAQTAGLALEAAPAAAPAPVATPPAFFTPTPAAAPLAVAPATAGFPAAQPVAAAAPTLAPAAFPVAQPVAAAAPAATGVDVIQIRSFMGLGMDDASIAAATGAPEAVVAAIRQAPQA